MIGVRTDEQLVDDTLRGSMPAFAEIVERYSERLFRFLLGRCRSRADAEDALQDTFANAYRYLDSFNAKWRFSTWIYRIAIRNAARQPAQGLADYPVDELQDNTADPLQDCIRDTERQNLWVTARDLLSEDAYAAMWLRYAEDLAVRDVAKALDRSLSWTKVTLMRARNALQQEMNGQGPVNRQSPETRESYG